MLRFKSKPTPYNFYYYHYIIIVISVIVLVVILIIVIITTIFYYNPVANMKFYFKLQLIYHI